KCPGPQPQPFAPDRFVRPIGSPALACWGRDSATLISYSTCDCQSCNKSPVRRVPLESWWNLLYMYEDINDFLTNLLIISYIWLWREEGGRGPPAPPPSRPDNPAETGPPALAVSSSCDAADRIGHQTPGRRGRRSGEVK